MRRSLGRWLVMGALFAATGAGANPVTPLNEQELKPVREAPPPPAQLTPDTSPPEPGDSSFATGAPLQREKKQVRGFFVDDSYRYPRFGLLPGIVIRTFMDLVSIPSGIPGWSGGDFALAGSVLALTAALSISVNGPSIDVKVQNTFSHFLDGKDHPVLWSPYGDFLIWSAIWGMTASIFVYGLAAEEARYVETAALMLEAFFTTQILHLGMKLLTGRQGPKDGDGQGYYGGPAAFFELFPSGTPSGHVATMYALFSALMNYWQNPVLNIALGTAALVFSATIISDNYHYASDVILGAALGYCVGRWVVHHRSSRFHNGEDGKVHEWKDNIVLAPAMVPGGGFGIGASLRF